LIIQMEFGVRSSFSGPARRNTSEAAATYCSLSSCYT
jgi:hypothetical protein